MVWRRPWPVPTRTSGPRPPAVPHLSPRLAHNTIPESTLDFWDDCGVVRRGGPGGGRTLSVPSRDQLATTLALTRANTAVRRRKRCYPTTTSHRTATLSPLPTEWRCSAGRELHQTLWRHNTSLCSTITALHRDTTRINRFINRLQTRSHNIHRTGSVVLML